MQSHTVCRVAGVATSCDQEQIGFWSHVEHMGCRHARCLPRNDRMGALEARERRL